MGSNCEKNLFKHNQELIAENEALKIKISQTEAETANKYIAIIYRLEEIIKNQNKKIAALEAHIQKQDTEIDRLRKQINNDSGNSSNPPSTDQKPNGANTYNGRSKTGNKTGGQNGHKGRHLSREAVEEKIASGQMRREVVAHGNPEGAYTSKYVIDLKMEAVAVEHRFYGDTLIPPELWPEVQYGSEIKAVAVTLAGQGLVASNRIVDMLKSWTNGAVELSDGTVYNFLAEFNAKAQSVVETIKTKLLNNTVLHIDETGARVNAHNMFFRNYSDENRVLYTANRTKGKKAIEDDGILPHYFGILVHDHNTVDYNFGLGHGECNVHLIRYLTANSENTHHGWSDDMIEFLLMVKRSKALAQLFGSSGFETEDMKRYESRYDEILTEGFEVLKSTKSKFYRDEERKLLNRLKKYRDNHLLFAANFNVPFDNNLSERDLRMLKTKGKVSGCFRSLDGAKIFANLMTVVKSAIKQNFSPYLAVKAVFQGYASLA